MKKNNQIYRNICRLTVRTFAGVLGLLLASCVGSPVVPPVTKTTAPASSNWPTMPQESSNIPVPIELSFDFPSDASRFAICLSGGGYRAALFHLGVLWRLNEGGQLKTAARIVGVSGGAITTAVVGANWASVDGDPGKFLANIAEPILELTSHTGDVKSLVIGTLTFSSPSRPLTQMYRKYLFKNHETLQSFPPLSSGPEVILLASDMRTGS